jgi:hypothetical protein
MAAGGLATGIHRTAAHHSPEGFHVSGNGNQAGRIEETEIAIREWPGEIESQQTLQPSPEKQRSQ